MSRIRSRNTSPERAVRHALWHKGYRYRLNDKRLPGSPDLVLPKYRAVIFINGCFWHGHRGCTKYVVPKTNEARQENRCHYRPHRGRFTGRKGEIRQMDRPPPREPRIRPGTGQKAS